MIRFTAHCCSNHQRYRPSSRRPKDLLCPADAVLSCSRKEVGWLCLEREQPSHQAQPNRTQPTLSRSQSICGSFVSFAPVVLEAKITREHGGQGLQMAFVACVVAPRGPIRAHAQNISRSCTKTALRNFSKQRCPEVETDVYIGQGCQRRASPR